MMAISKIKKKKIKIQFKYFWDGFDYRDCFRPLLEEYDFHITDDPDFVVYSCFQPNNRIRFTVNRRKMPNIISKAIRIFYTGENVRPQMDRCDYAISFCHDDDIRSPRHFRIPNYYIKLFSYGKYNAQSLIKRYDNFQEIFLRKQRFCNFIYSNPLCKTRNAFFHKLAAYKHIDSAGKVLNNIGGPIPMNSLYKIDFMSAYKFTIAFENTSYPGYTTEKLVEAMLANTVPIYWGNPKVFRDFSPKSFINFYDCDCDLNKLRKKVEEVDQNDDLYMSYLKEPFLSENTLPKTLDPNYILDVFKHIFQTT